MLLRSGDTPELDLGACARYKDNIDEGEILDLFEDRSWFVAEASVFGHLCQTFPEHVGKEADQDMSLNAIFPLMPERPKSCLWIRKAASACVSWMYAFQRSSAVQSLIFVRRR